MKMMQESINTYDLSSIVITADHIDAETIEIENGTFEKIELVKDSKPYMTLHSIDDIAIISSYQSIVVEDEREENVYTEIDYIKIHDNKNSDDLECTLGPAKGTLELVSNYDKNNPNNLQIVTVGNLTIGRPEEFIGNDRMNLVRERSLFSVKNYQFIVNSNNYFTNSVKNDYYCMLRFTCVNTHVMFTLINNNAKALMIEDLEKPLSVVIEDKKITDLFQPGYSHCSSYKNIDFEFYRDFDQKYISLYILSKLNFDNEILMIPMSNINTIATCKPISSI